MDLMDLPPYTTLAKNHHPYQEIRRKATNNTTSNGTLNVRHKLERQNQKQGPPKENEDLCCRRPNHEIQLRLGRAWISTAES